MLLPAVCFVSLKLATLAYALVESVRERYWLGIVLFAVIASVTGVSVLSLEPEHALWSVTTVPAVTSFVASLFAFRSPTHRRAARAWLVNAIVDTCAFVIVLGALSLVARDG